MKGTCKLCKELIRANGTTNFDEKIRQHYWQKHNPEHMKMQERKKTGQEELRAFKARYPEFYISYGDLRLRCLDLVDEIKEDSA